MTRQNYLNTFYFSFLLFGVCLYIFIFWKLPLTEDSGYYGFLSKEMLQGAVLHNDIPVMSNSLLVYLTTILFKLFGATKLTYRMIYGFGYLLLVLSVYKLVSKQRSIHEAFVASIICAILVMIPHVMLDLGRNQIIWCLAFIVIGLHFKLNLHKSFFAGLCFAIAALMRETFLIVLVLYAIFLLLQIIKNKQNENRSLLIKEFIHFCMGAGSGLFINVVLLTYYHSWSNYFTDMLKSGVSFRYKHHGLIKYLRTNLKNLQYGFTNYYWPFALFSALSFFYPAKKDSLVRLLQYVFIPIFFVEAVIVNRTETYSIAPLLVVFSILSVYFLVEMVGSIVKTNTRKIPQYVVYVISILTLVALPQCLYQIYGNYYGYYALVASNKNNLQIIPNWTTERIKNIIDNLPATKNIGTNSMYPLLFEVDRSIHYQYPYLYDLSAPGNFGRPILEKDQAKGIENQDADIMVLKSTENTIIPIGFDNYITIANFTRSEESTVQPYSTCVLLSRNFLNERFHKVKSLHKYETNSGLTVANDNSKIMLVRIKTSHEKCIEGLKFSNGLSQITYDSTTSKNHEIYGLILPHTVAQIETVKGCNLKKSSFINIDLYNTYETKI